MGVLAWLLGRDEEKHEWPSNPPPPIPTKSGAGPDIDAGRIKTQTEKDLRRVQRQYDADTDSFDPQK